MAKRAKKAKRGHGEGSVYLRGKTWWISYYIGKTRKQESSGSTDKGAAKQLLRERLTEIGRGQGNQFLGFRFEQTATEWLDWITRKNEHTPGTISGWGEALHRHLIPVFGEDYLHQLVEDPLIWDDYVTAKLNNEASSGDPLPVAGDAPSVALSPSTVRKHLTVLSMIFDYALLKKRVALNPIKTVIRPSDQGDDPEPFELADVQAIREQLNEEDDLCVMLMVGLGLRIGEVFGLQLRDWNSKKRELKIRRTVKRGPRGEYYLEELRARSTKARRRSNTKTPAAKRELILSENLAARVDAQIARLAGEGRIPETGVQMLFPNSRGALKNIGNWRRRIWDKAIKAAGLFDPETMHEDDKPTPHRCRHTYASEQIAAGVSLPVIAYRMGHASARVTMTVYAHILRRQQRDVADSSELYESGPADSELNESV